MKKGLLLMSVALLLTGCGGKELTKDKDIIKKDYTNKFECTRTEKIYNGNGEVKITKIYDFNKEGDKLLGYYEIATYIYTKDVDMNEEKSKYLEGCESGKEYGYINCKASVKDNVLTVSKEADLNHENNKEEASTMTKESIAKDYEDGEMYTCK